MNIETMTIPRLKVLRQDLLDEARIVGAKMLRNLGRPNAQRVKPVSRTRLEHLAALHCRIREIEGRLEGRSPTVPAAQAA